MTIISIDLGEAHVRSNNMVVNLTIMKKFHMKFQVL